MAGWISLLLPFIGAIHLASCTSPPANATHLHVNAITAINGSSTLQCWSVDPPFSISQQPGTVGAKIQALGDTTDSTIVFFNETHDFDGGLHRAPAPLWGIVLKGNGTVTFPNTDARLGLSAGDIFLGIDTSAVSQIGHHTKWVAGSVVMQVPFKDKVIPRHTVVVQSGLCADTDSYSPESRYYHLRRSTS